VESAEPLPESWSTCKTYLRGVDLFNHGYFWEAHETWESLWRVAKPRGTVSRFLKGLIKLAAACVKVREGVPAGVESHARRAGELFESVIVDLSNRDAVYMGIRLEEIIAAVRALSAHAPTNDSLSVFIRIQTPLN
jgi:predicted metal-dependent hydrolase